METSDRMRKLFWWAAVLLGAAAVLVTVPIFAHQAASEDNSEARLMIKDECAFSDEARSASVTRLPVRISLGTTFGAPETMQQPLFA